MGRLNGVQSSDMDKLIEQNRQAILRIAQKHGAGNVRVFGSRVRNDSRPDSDVDLLVDVVGPLTPWWPGGLIVELEELLKCSIDVGLEKELHPLIRDQVIKEAQPL